MDSLNFELAAEYLVMAATLAEIKSRMLLPKVEEEDDETDPRLDLIRRLQEYQVFKTVSEELANMDRVNRDFYLASVGMPKVEKRQMKLTLMLQDSSQVWSRFYRDLN